MSPISRRLSCGYLYCSFDTWIRLIYLSIFPPENEIFFFNLLRYSKHYVFLANGKQKICKRQLRLFLLQTFNVVLAGLELWVTLVHFAIRKFLSTKLGTMLITRAKALAVIFLAWLTPMNNVFLKTSPILNLGWDIGTNPETGRGLGVIQVYPFLPTGTAVLRTITAKVETVSC